MLSVELCITPLLGWASRDDESLRPVIACFVTGARSQGALAAPAPSGGPQDRGSAVLHEFTRVCRPYHEESKHINELHEAFCRLCRKQTLTCKFNFAS